MGRARWRREKRWLVSAAAVVVAGVLMAAVGAAAEPTGTSSPRAGVRAESLGVHFDQTAFSRVDPLPDGSLVVERDGKFWSYSPQGRKLSETPSPGYGRSAYVAPAADGKRLVINDSRELTRRNPDGSVDTGFGSGGKAELRISGGAAAELPSGKIVVAGCVVAPKGPSFLSIQMLNPDGSVDKGFGSEGILGTELTGGGASCAAEIVVTPEGGSLIVGGGFLLELLPDGTPDPAFGSGGSATGLPDLVSARILADGSIEAVGSTSRLLHGDFAVVRYTAAGAPDSLFGPHGVRSFDFGGDEEAHVASWAADGSVLVGGVSEASQCQNDLGCKETPIVAAFDPGGALDAGFAEAGLLRLAAVTDATGGSHGGVLGLGRRPDGSVIAAGTAAPKQTVAFMAAFSARGALLPGFGEGGLVRLREPVPASLSLAGMVPLANGDLLLSGDSDVDQEAGPVLARFAPDGGLVRSFGGGKGFVQVANNQASGLVANASGEVLFGTYDYPRSRLVELHASDGSPIASFGAGGTVTMPDQVRVEDLGIDRAGGAVVVGTQRVAGDPEPGVVLRYRPDGKLDRRFGQAGRVDLRFGGREARAGAFGGIDRGRILVGGLAGSFRNRRFALTSLLPDGKRDPRFGFHGWSVPFAGGAARSLALARVGPHIYLAGVVRPEGERPRVVLLRFDRSGRLDRSFGHAGRRDGPHPVGAKPTAIIPTRRGILVVLDTGPRPLLLFGRDGKVQRQRIPAPARYVNQVLAARAGRRLILGWSVFSKAIKGLVPHFSSRPLP
jgi:uncharacterized delta-60 repeat protein